MATVLRRLGRIPVILAVLGSFLNSGDLLAEFQPIGRAWVGYVAAASVGIGLYLCVEGLLKRPHWTLIAGVVFFGLAEVSGQLLHAALVRSDVAIMTEFLRWLMGYVSPALVVVAGIVMAFVVQYGFPKDGSPADDQPVTSADLERLEGFMLAILSNVEQTAQGVQPTRKRAGASGAQLPLVLPATRGAARTNGGASD